MMEAVTGATVEEGPWAPWFVGLLKEAEPGPLRPVPEHRQVPAPSSASSSSASHP